MEEKLYIVRSKKHSIDILFGPFKNKEDAENVINEVTNTALNILNNPKNNLIEKLHIQQNIEYYNEFDKIYPGIAKWIDEDKGYWAWGYYKNTKEQDELLNKAKEKIFGKPYFNGNYYTYPYYEYYYKHGAFEHLSSTELWVLENIFKKIFEFPSEFAYIKKAKSLLNKKLKMLEIVEIPQYIHNNIF